MSVKHIIRTKDGKTTEVELTRQQAITFFCTECMGFEAAEVKKCTANLCPLYPYRKGTYKSYQ